MNFWNVVLIISLTAAVVCLLLLSICYFVIAYCDKQLEKSNKAISQLHRVQFEFSIGTPAEQILSMEMPDDIREIVEKIASIEKEMKYLEDNY